MKNKSLITSVVWIAAIGLCLSTHASAAGKSVSPSPEVSASPAAKSATRPIPFHGMVSTVDQKASNFTIAGKEKSRVFNVTDRTQVAKGANAATIKDIAENQEVSGSYWKNADGSLEAKTVKIGPMKVAKASPSPNASPRKP